MLKAGYACAPWCLDAPALVAVDIGVAMRARHALMVEVRRIALQSMSVGLTLSVGATVAAAYGYLQPVKGPVLQEATGVTVILNALRALR